MVCYRCYMSDLNVRGVPEEVMRGLRMAAVESGSSIKDCVLAAVGAWLERGSQVHRMPAVTSKPADIGPISGQVPLNATPTADVEARAQQDDDSPLPAPTPIKTARRKLQPRPGTDGEPKPCRHGLLCHDCE